MRVDQGFKYLYIIKSTG